MSARLAGSLRTWRTFARLCWAVSPPLAVASLVILPVLSALLVVQAVWLRWLVDAAIERDTTRALWAVSFLALTQGADALLFAPTLNFQLTVGERLSLLVGRRIAELANAVPDLSLHEDPLAQDHLVQLQRPGVFNTLVATVAGAILTVLGIAVALVVLVTVHPALIAVPLVAIPNLLVVARSGDWIKRGELEAAPHERLAQHWATMAQAAASNRELRVYNAGAFALEQHARHAATASGIRLKARRRVTLAGLAAGVVTNLGLGGALAFLLYRTTQGGVSAGQLVAVVFVFPEVIRLVNVLHGTTANLHEAGPTIERYLWIVDRVAGHRAGDRAGAGEASQGPGPQQPGLVVEDLSFSYPGSERAVLTGIDLSVPPGTVVAIVGENGAGKTTLAKLLSRLYEPSAGRIAFDGEEIGRIDLEAWRARSTACYQDYARLELTLREAVGVGNLPRIGDDAEVTRALNEARGGELLAQLDRGLDTQLGRTWPGGVDLSLGQWQRVALARSRMRPHAALTILDEPSASLDAQTEYELFDAARAQTREVAGHGGITVLISHRFSTVQMADLIVVLKDGAIAERGSHEELMGIEGGTYAELYRIQAAAYRESSAP
jgi:ATP-binding cassette, subfamily B, bacterial